MARIDLKDVTTLVLGRLVDQCAASIGVFAAHEAAPPGDPTHDEYQSSWCRLQPITPEPAARNVTTTQDQMSIAVVVQVVSDTAATGLAPLAIETACELVAAALDEWTGLTGSTRVTLGRAAVAVNAEPDPENRFRTALVMTPGIADKT